MQRRGLPMSLQDANLAVQQENQAETTAEEAEERKESFIRQLVLSAEHPQRFRSYPKTIGLYIAASAIKHVGKAVAFGTA